MDHAGSEVAKLFPRTSGHILGQWKGELRKQFNAMADAKKMFLIQYANRENLLRIVATHKPGEPYKLDEIMEQGFNENIKMEIEI